MKDKITTVFFDLDHTLWDYDTNALQTLREIYNQFEVSKVYDDFGQFSETFFRRNAELWDQYNRGVIGREHIRQTRFKQILADSELAENGAAVAMSDYFTTEGPRKSALIDGSIEILDYLSQSYRMAVITNGFTDVQAIKLSHSGIDHYFEEVITSESAEARKPSAEIFDHALDLTGNHRDEVVMIGDNLDTDIKGAHAADWHAIWFTTSDEQAPAKTVKVRRLQEITALL